MSEFCDSQALNASGLKAIIVFIFSVSELLSLIYFRNLSLKGQMKKIEHFIYLKNLVRRPCVLQFNNNNLTLALDSSIKFEYFFTQLSISIFSRLVADPIVIYEKGFIILKTFSYGAFQNNRLSQSHFSHADRSIPWCFKFNAATGTHRETVSLLNRILHLPVTFFGVVCISCLSLFLLRIFPPRIKRYCRISMLSA